MAASPKFDDILRALGQHGRYQILQAIPMCAIWIPLSMMVLSTVFTGYEPDHQCKMPDNASTVNGDHPEGVHASGKCDVVVYTNSSGNVSVPCPNGYEYSRARETTFVAEWDLVCDRGSLDEFSQMLLMCGQTLGGVVFTTAADKFGRKPIHVTSHVICMMLSVLLAFSSNYVMLATIRFFIGAIIQGSGVPTFVLLMEWFPADDRVWLGTLPSVVWSITIAMMSPIAYLFRYSNWRYLQIAFAASSVYSLAEIGLVSESPRWLMANGKTGEATRIIKRAARFNRANMKDVLAAVDTYTSDASRSTNYEERVDREDGEETRAKLEENDSINHDKQEEVKFIDGLLQTNNPRGNDTRQSENISTSILDILRNKHTRWRAVFTWYLWFVNGLVFYGLLFSTSALSGDRFVNFFLGGMVQLPGLLLQWLLMRRLGRRFSLMILCSLSAISLLVSAILISTTAAERKPSGQVALVVQAVTMVGKMSITGTIAGTWIYTSELFPTNGRNGATGVAASFLGVAGMIAPFSTTMMTYVSWGPAVVFSSLSLACSIGFYFMPETEHRELPQLLKDVETWGNEDKNAKKKSPNAGQLIKLRNKNELK